MMAQKASYGHANKVEILIYCEGRGAFNPFNFQFNWTWSKLQHSCDVQPLCDVISTLICFIVDSAGSDSVDVGLILLIELLGFGFSYLQQPGPEPHVRGVFGVCSECSSHFVSPPCVTHYLNQYLSSPHVSVQEGEFVMLSSSL